MFMLSLTTGAFGLFVNVVVIVVCSDWVMSHCELTIRLCDLYETGNVF